MVWLGTNTYNIEGCISWFGLVQIPTMLRDAYHGLVWYLYLQCLGRHIMVWFDTYTYSVQGCILWFGLVLIPTVFRDAYHGLVLY